MKYDLQWTCLELDVKYRWMALTDKGREFLGDDSTVVDDMNHTQLLGTAPLSNLRVKQY